MPKTNIFGSGGSYSQTEYGGIDVKYHGDSMDITFNYFSKDKTRVRQDHLETKATLNVMTLKQIKNQPLYKAELQEKNHAAYNYLHQWRFEHKGNQLIVYSGNDELGFMFTSYSNDVRGDLNKLISHHMPGLPFFNELKFDLLVKNHWGTSIEALRKLPLMTEEKLAYFCQHAEKISALVNHAASLDQLSAMQFDKFKKLIDLSVYKLNTILTLVTMNQLLGVDHIAPPVPKEEQNKWNDNMRHISSFGRGSAGDYTYEHSGEDVTISFKKKWVCAYQSGLLKEEYVQQFKQIASKQPEQKLLHRWVEIPINVENEDSKVYHLYYSPDHKTIVEEKYDKDFPIDDLKKEYYHMLVYVPYFKEIITEKDLNNLGYSFETLRALNGMTERKLEIITQLIFVTENLLHLGLKMEELAQVEEDRLDYLMKHYSDVKEVAELVDIHEIVGIPALPSLSLGLDTNRNYAPNFYRTMEFDELGNQQSSATCILQ